MTIFNENDELIELNYYFSKDTIVRVMIEMVSTEILDIIGLDLIHLENLISWWNLKPMVTIQVDVIDLVIFHIFYTAYIMGVWKTIPLLIFICTSQLLQ